jgi:aspartyl-tRNA(Asn)/glutamyl-tRNA(Gln) amidotransferase subunit A
VPITAPTIASVAPGEARDAEFFRVNGLLLRNPSVVNMLDGCAISIPCQASGDAPVGLMLWHGALHDDAILALAAQVERTLQQ